MLADLEQMLKGIATNGWDGLDNAGLAARKMSEVDSKRFQEQRAIEAKIVAKALGDEDGLAALDLLVRKTLLRQTSEEERAARTAEHYAILKAKREGQNDLLFMIMTMLRVAKGEEPQGGTEP